MRNKVIDRQAACVTTFGSSCTFLLLLLTAGCQKLFVQNHSLGVIDYYSPTAEQVREEPIPAVAMAMHNTNAQPINPLLAKEQMAHIPLTTKPKLPVILNPVPKLQQIKQAEPTAQDLSNSPHYAKPSPYSGNLFWLVMKIGLYALLATAFILLLVSAISGIAFLSLFIPAAIAVLVLSLLLGAAVSG